MSNLELRGAVRGTGRSMSGGRDRGVVRVLCLPHDHDLASIPEMASPAARKRLLKEHAMMQSPGPPPFVYALPDEKARPSFPALVLSVATLINCIVLALR